MAQEQPTHETASGSEKNIWTVIKDNAALVTAVLALFGVLIAGAFDTVIASRAQEAQRELEADDAKSQRELEAFNAQKQRELEREKAQNAALQTYLDQMGQMLLNEDLRNSEEDSDLRTLARTLSVFAQSSAEGKRIALVFLHEATLIKRDVLGDPVINLTGGDLSEANLSKINLHEADLGGAHLSGADLREATLSDAALTNAVLSDAILIDTYLYRADLMWAVLRGADLREADLREANLREAILSEADLREADLRLGADLHGADLHDADLRGADLRDANLEDANLSGADLSGTNLSGADLSGANLEGVRAVTNEELEQRARSLKGTTMPNGQKYEDWLKDTEKRQQDE